jgi:putative cell wall-binding protein
MFKGLKKYFAGCVAISFLLASVCPAYVLGVTPSIEINEGVAPAVQRISGEDRYETAAKIAQSGWTSKSEYAILSAGMDNNLIDALAAAPLAKLKNAPILLTEGSELNQFTEAELKRLEVKTIYLTTGNQVISTKVTDKIKALGISIVLLGGQDRFETAINIAKQMGSFQNIVVATAWTNADALSIASIAAAKGMPILLSDVKDLPANVKAYVDSVRDKISCSYVLGGSAVLRENVTQALPNATRIAGDNRYNTNVEILKTFAHDMKYNYVYIANGEDSHSADAMVGAPLAALKSAPIVLTATELTEATTAFARLSLPPNLIALGGEAVVPTSILAELSTAVV